MATRLTQTGQEVQEILNKSTVSGQNIENVFGVGAGSDEILEPEQWLSGIKEYIDAGNTEDLYLLDHSPVVGESMEDIIEQLALSKAIIIRPPHACEFEIASASQIPGENGYYIFSIKYYPEDDYCSQLRYKISGESGNRVEGVEEREFLMTDTANMTFLKISAANAEYLKKADAENIYMRKSGGTFTSDVYFAGGLTSRQGRFYGVVTHQANVDMDGHKIQNLSEPTSPGDAVNKQHIDNNFYTKSEVDQKIQTETATYKGIFDKWSDVPYDSPSYPSDWGGFPPDKNDYIVVRDASLYAPQWISGNADGYNVGDYVVEYYEMDNSYYGTYICIEYNAGSMDLPSSDSEHWQRVTENPNYKGTWRFKYVENGEYVPFNFLPEYQINEEPLTPSQIAAINSGITSTKVGKLDALPTNSELQNTYMPKTGGMFTGAVGFAGSQTNFYKGLQSYEDIFLVNKKLTGTIAPTLPLDAANKQYVDNALSGKQDTLVSGTNVKTINGQNVLGPGNTVVGALQIPNPGDWDNDNSGMPFSQFFGHTVQELLKAGGAVDEEGFYYVVDGCFFADDDWQLYLYELSRINNKIAISGHCVRAVVDGEVSEPCINTIIALQDGKQDTLVSGQNIKTINSTSLLGSGDIQISADTSDCVKFGETINTNNSYLKIDGAGVPFSLMLVVTMDYCTSEYLVNGSEQSVGIVKMNGEQSFDGMLRIDDDTYYPIALYHEDSIVVTPILLYGTMPTITDLASASGDEEEIPYYLDSNSLKTINNTSLLGSGNIDVDKVFWATYNSTTYADIAAAHAAGKVCLADKGDNDYVYVLTYITATTARFTCARENGHYEVRCSSGNVWQTAAYNLQSTDNRVSTISGNETNTGKYPNTKAVADALGKIGVISQTQTWSGTGSNPRTYVMSNQVTGLIPQANIDLFESAGATFNSTTGYFELNGLTDLSYNEMQEVYYKTIAAKEIHDKSFMFAYDSSLRTNLPTSNVNRVSASYLSASNRVNLFYACIGAGIEVFAVLPVTATKKAIMSDMRASFNNAYNLKRIQGIWDFSNVSNAGNVFGNCYSLESVSIYHLKIALSLANSSLLDKASLLYMINNEASTSAITITLEASVYAKCQSGGEWYSDISTALAAHTNVSLASGS